jgi:protein TonB
MTDWVQSISRPRRVLEAALWIAAGSLVFTAHAAALMWALRAPPITMADQSPPPAIMLEMAAEPQAVNTDMNQVVDQTKDAPEIVSETAQSVPEQTEPVRDTVEVSTAEPTPEVTPPVEQTTVTLDKVEVLLPTAKSKPPEKKVVEKKKPDKPKRQKPQKQEQASQTSFAAAAQVKQSSQTAARQTVASLGLGSTSPAEWQSRLMAHLERRKRYPPGAREKGEIGTVYVRFRIDDAGNVLSVSLARSSGYSELDDEVLSLVHRASPVPAPPPGANKSITAPVRFTSG